MIEESMDRRTFARSSITTLALLGVGVHTATAASPLYSLDGIAGGGAMQAGEGPAEFSVFAARFVVENEEPAQLVGVLSYLDVAAKTTIESISVSLFSPLEGKESTTRQLSGIATINGLGTHPFETILTDSGPIGSGGDTFELRVGEDGAKTVENPVYTVQSAIQAGNLQLITISPDSTTAASPTPAG